MADLIDRNALMSIYKDWLPQLTAPEDAGDRNGVETCIAVLQDAPAVDAVEEKALNILLKQEFARLWSDDEKMREHMAGYNPSCFLAGYLYALDCVMGDITLLSRERRTNATDRC